MQHRLRSPGQIVVPVSPVPEHIFRERLRLDFREGGDYLGIGYGVQVHGDKLTRSVEPI